MRLSSFFFVLILGVQFTACKRSEQAGGTAQPAAAPAAVQQTTAANQPTPPTATNVSQTKAKTDACALLTSADIEAVQKEAVKDTKLSGTNDGRFSVSQCFFTLPTFTNSVSLQVTQRGDGSAARDPKEFWTETFHRERKSKRERERENAKAKTEEEEEREKAPPQKIAGVGDEAFWVGGRIGGALYVLKDNSYVRVSIGGAGAELEKIKKSKSLAQKVTERL